MRYNRKFSFSLLALGFLISCTWTAPQIAAAEIPKDILEAAKKVTVLISIVEADGSILNASGFFVEHDKIVTNIHVVNSARMVFAIGAEKVYNIEKVAGYDPERDLVILKVSGEGKPLELGEGRIGDAVFVVGYPGGEYKVTEGKIYGIRKSDEQLRLVSADFPASRGNFVIVPGNSGGPVLNSNKQVVGIAFSNSADPRSDALSFASTSSVLNTLLDSSDEENLSEWQKKNSILAYAYAGRANKKLYSGNYNEAIKGFDRAITLYPHAQFYINRGEAKSQFGFYLESIQDYTEAIKLIRDGFIAYYNRGLSKLNSKDYAGAIQDLNKVIELNPDDTMAYFNRGIARHADAFQDHTELDRWVILLQNFEAIQDYTEAINRNPKKAEIYSHRGYAQIKQGWYVDAVQDYNKVIELNPKEAAAYLMRGFAKEKKAPPDYAEAIQDYTKAINLNPDDTILGQAYYNRGNLKKALGQDGEAKLDYAKGYYYRGKANSNNGNYQNAIERLDESIALNPDYTVYYERGNTKRESGDYEGSIQDYTDAINGKRDYAEAYYERGAVQHLLGDKGNYRSAIEDFEVVIKLKSDYAEAYYMLGLTRHHLGESKKAINLFDRAIELKNPTFYAKAYEARGIAKEVLGEDADAKQDFVNVHYYWGDEAFKRAQYQEAIKSFNTVLELVPGLAHAYEVRGAVKAKLGKSKADLGDLESAQNLYKEAIIDYDKAIELDPEEALFYGNRGWTKFLRGALRDHNEAIEDYQGAIKDLTEAVKRKPDFIDQTYYLRGTARCLLGCAKANQERSKEARKQYSLAHEDFKKAIALDPDNASYYYALELANAALGKAKEALLAFEKAKKLKAKSQK